MTDRPILYTGAMVRSMIADLKTQTRRLKGVPTIEMQPNGLWHVHNKHGGVVNVAEEDIGVVAADYLPIQPADRLWVRENFWAEELDSGQDGYRFAADETFVPCNDNRDAGDKWGDLFHYQAKRYGRPKGRVSRLIPCLYMPRFLSRITLSVTTVRVERLQSISPADAIAEGIGQRLVECADGIERNLWFGVPHAGNEGPVQAYADLWESINNPRGLCADDNPSGWEANPWVAAYTFTVEKVNIDLARAA